jgi:putative DNA primase/helicase
MANEDILIQCKGKWRNILIHLGVNEAHLNPNKEAPCPICGGKTRARWISDNEYLHCRYHGDSGSTGIQTAALWLGMDIRRDYAALCARIREIEGLPTITETKKVDDSAKLAANAIKAKSIINESEKINSHDYLDYFKIKVPPLGLRFHKGLDLWEGKDAFIGNFPCFVCPIRDSLVIEQPLKKGESILTGILNIQLIYLLDNYKTEKRFLKLASYTQGVIKLFPVDDTLAIAEGVKSALSYYELEKVPVWATINSTQMARFKPPERVKKLIIVADNDKSFTGQKAAYECANRLAVHDDTKHIDISVVNFIDYKMIRDSGHDFDAADYLCMENWNA